MKSRFHSMIFAFFLSTMIISCVPISYECAVPPLDEFEFPDSFFKSNLKVLLLPVWYKPGMHLGDPVNMEKTYMYFDRLIITTTEDLGDIKNKIASKTSFGLVFPGSAHGKWDRFVSLFMILENGLVFHLNAGSPLRMFGEEQAWREIYFGWIGPRWKHLIPQIITNSDKRLEYFNEFADNLTIPDLHPYSPVIELRPIKSSISKAIKFVEQVQIDSRISAIDKWTVFYFVDPNSRESISMRDIPKEKVNSEYSFPVEFPIYLSAKVACEMPKKDANIGWQVIVELSETQCKENGGKELWLIPRLVKEHSEIDCLLPGKNKRKTIEADICINDHNGKIIMKQSN